MTILATKPEREYIGFALLAKSFATANLLIFGIFAPPTVSAYVGPGAGITLLGTLLAVLAALALTVVGIVLWPVRLLSQRRKRNLEATKGQQATDAVATQDEFAENADILTRDERERRAP